MKKVVFIILLCFSQASFAQHARSVDPEIVHVYAALNAFIVYAEVNEGVAPTCGAMDANRWAVGLNSPGSKEIISMVIAAKTAGRKITVLGNGTCDASGQGLYIVALYLE